MIVYVLPISGGSFPTQLEILSCLGEFISAPDVTFACSGGNIAAYIASAGSWKRSGINRVLKNVSSDLMLRRWAPGPLMYVYAWFTSNLYAGSDCINQFFHSVFNRENIQRDEIWTGAYDRRHQKMGFFCNLATPRHIHPALDTRLLQCHPPKFLRGDVDAICNVTRASASIPTFVQSVECYEGEYCDGGVGYASTFSCLSHSIPMSGKPVHIFYINGMDVEACNPRAYGNIFYNGISTMGELTRGKILDDRERAVRFITRKQSHPHREDSMHIDILDMIHKRLVSGASSSMIEIYPSYYVEVDITAFDIEDITRIMSKGNLRLRIWWEGPHDLLRGIY